MPLNLPELPDLCPDPPDLEAYLAALEAELFRVVADLPDPPDPAA